MIRIACLASGQGTNVIRLLEASRHLERVKITTLMVDQPEAPVIQRVQSQYPDVKVVLVVEATRVLREQKILEVLHEQKIDWCFLAGFMRILSADFIQKFRGQSVFAPIINLHPSLLPRHPGLNAIQKSYQSNDSQAGITLHLVDEGVDTGPILLQKSFVHDPRIETEQLFVEKIKSLEWECYPKMLEMLDQNVTLIAIPEKPEVGGQRRAQLFWVYSDGQALSLEQWKQMAARLSDRVDQDFWVNPSLEDWNTLHSNPAERVQIQTFLPGVTDNPAAAFRELLGFENEFRNRDVRVCSGEACVPRSPERPNPLIFNSSVFAATNPALNSLHLRPLITPDRSEIKVETFHLNALSDSDLEKLSQSRHWALSLDEMKVIQQEFQGRLITDVEIEVIAQTWSEHCKHKIFRAEITYTDQTRSGDSTQIRGLFKEFIQNPTSQLQKKKPWLVSVFSDNAGIVRFHREVDVCIKVETHNSPSALDPYGGALTGILGVNRDILGTGLGARPIANTNVLCFGDPAMEFAPAVGLLPPHKVLKGVHRGIQDGGNKSGIPTVNGAIFFDESYSGKPLVYCGTVGVIPQNIQDKPSHLKGQRAGDKIVVVGGSVGLDGVHGATSSSLGLTESTPAGMVQIGDPLTQKRVLDFILYARDRGLYNSITDNGAGGISSSIGEMAASTGGAQIDLSQVPLKYPGLQPWQIMVSESQERMTLSVPPENEKELLESARAWGVQAVTLGAFTDDGFLNVVFGDQKVAQLSLQFLHDGLPAMKLKATWSGPRKTLQSEHSLRLPVPVSTGPRAHLLKLARHPSLQSKEPWVRQFDHEVQAATAKKPYEGTYRKGQMGFSAPNEGALIWMGAHGALDEAGRPTKEGVGVGSGFAPYLSDQDPDWMAVCAVDEAVRNVVVLGCDPEKIALTDNFCWPDPIASPSNPDGEQKLAELVRTCQGMRRMVLAYEMPLVSGKDSMKNDFKGKRDDGTPVQISVLPTLLVTAIAYHPDVNRGLNAHFVPGQTLYRVGKSWTAETFDPIQVRSLYQKFFEAYQKGWMESARDVSEGGVAFAVCEGLLLSRGGIRLEVPERELFFETPGQFVIGVQLEKARLSEAQWIEHFGSAQVTRLGKVDSQGVIEISGEKLKLEEFESHYRGLSGGGPV